MLTQKKCIVIIILIILSITALSCSSKNIQNEHVNTEEETESIDATIQESESETEEETQLAKIASIADLTPGDIFPADQLDLADLSKFFISFDIVEGDAVYNRIIGKSYQPNDNIALNDLCYLKMLHYNFDGEIQIGEMIVNQSIKQDCLEIFEELFKAQYQINRMVLIDEYWTGDSKETDAVSIKNNNTSCFIYRNMIGSSNVSKHALGLAIDINPYQNPYVPTKGGKPDYSALDENEYYYATNRSEADAHVITYSDLAYKLLKEHGFSWGGNWNSLKDYQHFEKNN